MAFIFLSSNERRIRAGRAGMNMNSRTPQGMVLDWFWIGIGIGFVWMDRDRDICICIYMYTVYCTLHCITIVTIAKMILLL